MAVVNGGFLHYMDMKKFLKFFFSEAAGQILKKIHREVLWVTQIAYGPPKKSVEQSRAKLALLFDLLPQSHILMLKIYISVENIVRTGEIACNKQFFLFLQCFLAYLALIFHIKCTLKCHLQFVSIWISL